MGESRLAAAEEGTLDLVKRMIHSGADVNATNKVGETALMFAPFNGHLEVVRYLVETGHADVNATNKTNGWTALMYAAYNGHFEVVRYLVEERGVDVNATDNDGETALMRAAANGHLDVVQHLVKACRANVEVMNKNNGCTALMYAARNGHTEVIQYLVKEGSANVNAADKSGWTALMFAALNGNLKVVQHLVDECDADVNATNKTNGWTALMYAARNGHTEVIQYLVKEGSADVNTTDKDGRTALIRATYTGDLELVKHLVNDCNADVNAAGESNGTALLCASRIGSLDVVKWLVEEGGADVNAKLKDGSTPLMCAAFKGHLEVVKYLVSVYVNSTNENGWTALMFAALNGDLKVVQYLVKECGADVNTRDKDGWTVLMFAALNGHLEVVRYLVDERGVDVNATDKDGLTVLMKAGSNGQIEVVRYLVEERRVDVNSTNENKSTVMKLAAGNGHLEVVQYLVEKRGAVVNSTDINRATALMGAACNGHLDVVRYFIKVGADVNCTDNNGWTALMFAAHNGHLEVVQCLVKEGHADVNATRKDERPAIQIAADRGYQEITRFLTSFLKFSQPTEISSFDLPLFNIPPSEIALTQLVETNTFGGDYLAKWLDADVVIRLFIPKAARSSFEEEVQLWKQLRHPNVIKMYGACEADPDLRFFVCEYADGGSLIDYVKSNPEETRTVWKYLYEAALGLEYLHERGIVHGDLRCSNIVIGSDGLVRLSNFRLSGKKSGASSSVGSVRWQAPEMLEGKEASPFASDVYSLGMCILEAITGKKPWDDKNEFRAEHDKIRWTPETEKFSSLDAPKCPHGDAHDLVWRMCCKDPTKRIKLKFVVYELECLVLKESLGLSQSEPEHEPVCTLDTFKFGEIKELWGMVDTRMKNINNAQYHQLFDELKSLYKYLHESTHLITLLTRFLSLLTEFHTVITMTAEQALAMRLSSTRATSNSIYAFHRHIQSLWVALGHPVDDGVAQSDAQRREMFVSGVSDLYLLLRELESDDEKAAFLEMLKREMTDQYTPTQLETMRKAVEVIERKIGKESLVPEWFIPWYELIKNEEKCLGVGGFGSVVRAKWLDSEVVVKQVVLNDPENTPLVQSVTSSTSDVSVEAKEDDPDELAKQAKKREEAMKIFRREVDIWFGFSHPHVIQLFGACHVGRPYFVCEYATNGTLDKYLQKHPDELWQKLYEAALGVQYLHAREVVHGDLKGNNIVIGSDLKAKVTDFGLSSIASDGGEPRISAASHWVAPECFLAEPQLTFASDVYSLGMCIVEAMRVVGGEEHSLPWRDIGNVAVREYATRGGLPPRPSQCTDDQWKLVNRMCALQPEKRIKISTVVDELARLASKKDDAIAETPSMESVPDVVSSARTVLTELDDTKYVDLWDQLEKMHKRINDAESSKVLCCLVKDAETATLKLRDKKTDLISSLERTMAVYALRRRVVKIEEAYPADEEHKPIGAHGASSARCLLAVDCN